MPYRTTKLQDAMFAKRWLISAFLLLLMLCASVIIFIASHTAQRYIQKAYLNQASALANALPADQIVQLTGAPSEAGGTAHQNINKTLAKVAEKLTDARSVYIMRKSGDDYIFVGDSEPTGSPLAASYGEVYASTSDTFRAGYASGTAFLEEPIADKWGEWVSLHAPILSDSGETLAVVGIDMDVDYWEIKHDFLKLLTSAMLALTLLMTLAAWFFYLSTRKNYKKAKKNQFLAYHDPLTGLANRHHAMQELKKWLADAQHTHQPFTLLYFDLNNLKQVNDRYGHLAGDAMLLEFAKRLKDLLDSQAHAFFARMGGDEFVALVDKLATKEEVEHLKKQINAYMQHPVPKGKIKGLNIETSIGYAMYPANGDNVVDLLQAADTSMYADKNRNKLANQPHVTQLKQPNLLNQP